MRITLFVTEYTGCSHDTWYLQVSRRNWLAGIPVRSAHRDDAELILVVMSLVRSDPNLAACKEQNKRSAKELPLELPLQCFLQSHKCRCQLYHGPLLYLQSICR